MEHTIHELQIMQGLSLNDKVKMTKERIKAWIDHFGLENCAISFSGGKDSTVLLDIAREDYPNIEAVHVNTGLEFPEIEDFVKTYDNVTILKPKMNFVEVIRKYGYPMISKEVSETVYGARKYLRKIGGGEKQYKYRLDRLNGTGKYRGGYLFEFNKLCGFGKYASPNEGGYDRKYRRIRGIGNFAPTGIGERWTGISDSPIVRDARQEEQDKGEYP